MIIRKYKKTDQKAVKDFVLHILEEYRFCHRPEWDYDLEDPHAHYLAKGGIFLVCFENGKVVGTVAVKPIDDKVVELKRLYLHPDVRSKGHGQKLVDMMLEFSQEKNFKKIVLDTWIGMKAAQNLYLKKGFTVKETKGEQMFMEKILKM